MLFCAAPRHCYADPAAFDNVDLSDFQLPGGRSMPVVDRFCYLGSMVNRHGGDRCDVDSRLEQRRRHLVRCAGVSSARRQ